MLTVIIKSRLRLGADQKSQFSELDFEALTRNGVSPTAPFLTEHVTQIQMRATRKPHGLSSAHSLGREQEVEE